MMTNVRFFISHDYIVYINEVNSKARFSKTIISPKFANLFKYCTERLMA